MNDMWALIEEAVAARDWEKLIGRAEDSVFEAKGRQPYDFTQPQAQYELAKDVSAFANAEGGWIIIGLKTRKVAERALDVVDALDLLAEANFRGNELKGRIEAFVKPEITGLEVRWVENGGTPGWGVGVIRIPKQNQDRKPFLIYHVIEDGAKLDHIVFGYSERVGDAANPLSFAQIQRRMQTGMSPHAERLTRMEGQLDRIEEAMQSMREPPVVSTAPAYDRERLRERIARLSEAE
jgi:hypothetical protein